MRDEDKNRQQLLEELHALQQQLASLQQSETEYRRRVEEYQSEKQRANVTQLESEDKLRLLADHINTVFWVMDATGSKMLYVSPAYERLWGRTCQSLYENIRSFLDAIHPDDREMADQAFRQQITEGHVDAEYRLMLPDSSVHWTWIRGYSIRNGEGAITGHMGICEDITERKVNELAKSRLAAIVESSDDAILSKSLDGFIITWNLGAERLYGYAAEEIIGQSISILIPPGGQQEYQELIKQVKRGERIPSFETVRKRKDGTLIQVLVSITPIVIRRGQIDSASVIARDITKIKQLEREIRQAHKMEAVGMLAGGVAHDFNNVLTVIMSNCDLLRKPLAPDDPSRLMLDQIHSAGERAGLLTRQLLAFSAKQLLQPKVLNLNSVVNETEQMLRRLIGEDIIVSLVLDPALGNVKVDLGQVQQVLMNLAANSRDAMPQGGKLTIETKNVVFDQAHCSLHPHARPGNYSLLAVIDNGIGMDEKTKVRIFEPFFTTKEVGKGTGLGMATVYGIAKQNGGHVDVCSKLGQGTTFKIYLPQVQEPIESRALHPDRIAVPEGEETVLLAEDDDAVRGATAHMLESCGYRVLEAANGEEAFELSESHKGPIDLLVCDVVMPDFSGRKLAERIAERRPDLKVLFISGYTDDAVIRYGILESEIDFLQKPFTLASLAQKIRKVLDRPDERK